MDNNIPEKKMPDIEMTGLRSDTDSSTTTLLDHMESDDRANTVDVEKDSATESSAPTPVQTNRVTLIFWMVLNTVATVAIVSGVFLARCDRNVCRQRGTETLRK